MENRMSIDQSHLRRERRAAWSPSFATALLATCVLALSLLGSTGLEAADGETVVVGTECVPGKTFAFCLDRTGSMSVAGSMDLQRDLVIAALLDLEPTQSFILLSFGGFTSVYNQVPLSATPGNVLFAIQYVASLNPEGSDGMAAALNTSLNLLEGYPEPALVLVADNQPATPGASETLLNLQAWDLDAFTIHTVRLASVQSTPAIEFLQDLAALGNGSFVDLTTPPPGSSFVRGDANGDGVVNLADAIEILQIGFGLSTDPTCLPAHDVNADDSVEAIADAVTLLGTLFLTTFPPISEPYPDCGVDPVAPICPPPCEVQFCP